MRRLGVLTLLFAVAVTAGEPAQARADMHGLAALRLEAGWDTQHQLADDAERVHRGVLGLGGRATLGGKRLQYACGLDLALGFEVPGAFVYRFDFLPLGFGFKLGGRGIFAVIGGIGIDGATSHLPFAMQLPLEAWLAFDLGRWLRVNASARVAGTPYTEARRDGSEHAPFGDELELRLGFEIGKRESEWGMLYSDGNYIGAVYREQGGERYLGATVAVAIDFSWRGRGW